MTDGKKGRKTPEKGEGHTKNPRISFAEFAFAMFINPGVVTGGVSSFTGRKSSRNFSTGKGPKKIRCIWENGRSPFGVSVRWSFGCSGLVGTASGRWS